MELIMHFEKEAVQKKRVLELEQDSEMLAFQLFGKEIELRKLQKSDNVAMMGIECDALNNEISVLKQKMSHNNLMKKELDLKMQGLKDQRNELLFEYKDHMEDKSQIDVMFNKHVFKLKKIDYERHEKRADFHIKQREMFITQLKKQLAL